MLVAGLDIPPIESAASAATEIIAWCRWRVLRIVLTSAFFSAQFGDALIDSI